MIINPGQYHSIKDMSSPRPPETYYVTAPASRALDQDNPFVHLEPNNNFPVWMPKLSSFHARDIVL